MFFPSFLLIFTLVLSVRSEFTMPDVTLEAYTPSGLRASIPAMDGIQFFAFHANINQEIAQSEQGEYHGEYRTSKDNLWTYFNPNVTLKAGDKVHYWVFLQFQKLGYRRNNQAWTVTDLLPLRASDCQKSDTVLSGKSLVCQGDIIFEDNFNGDKVDTKKWQIENYIPQAPDFEFVSYQNSPEVVSATEGWLVIQPKAAQTEAEVRGELILKSCTRTSLDECSQLQNGVFILPPVTSGRIVQTSGFRYGVVEIKARLPAGDWIYPQIYLECISKPEHKLHLAYARGNEELTSASGTDIGAKLIFGGPVLESREPVRSTYLKTNRHSVPFTSEMHTYTVKWSKNAISLSVDGVQFGLLSAREVREVNFSENDFARLVLGVGVGGINDFPDNFKSGNEEKPWVNRGRTQVRDFFTKRNNWSKTWTSPLQVDYVKITALS